MELIEIDVLPQPAGTDAAVVIQKLNRALAHAIPCRLDAVRTVWGTITVQPVELVEPSD